MGSSSKGRLDACGGAAVRHRGSAGGVFASTPLVRCRHLSPIAVIKSVACMWAQLLYHNYRLSSCDTCRLFCTPFPWAATRPRPAPVSAQGGVQHQQA